MSELTNPSSAVGSSGTSPAESLTRMVRNSAFNAMGTALILPFNFIGLFTLARRLGKDSLGTFFTIFAISAVIHWIADCGVATVLTHRVAKTPDRLRHIVSEAAGMLVLVAIASCLLFYVAAAGWLYVSGESIPWLMLLVAALSMVSRHTLDFAANAFRGLERFEFENLSRALQTGSFCLFVWVGVYPETGGTLAAFTAFMASNLIAAAFIVTILVWKWECRGFCLNRAVAHNWLRESMPLGFGDAIRRLIMQMDTLLLAAFRPAAAVGLFSVAYRPLQPLQLLPRAIVSVTFPMMSRVAHSDRAAMSRAFARTTNFLWVVSLPISLLTTAFAAPLILSTAGPDFAEAIWPLRLLIWVAPLVFLNAQLRFAFTALDAQRRYWRVICSVAGVKLMAELLLIPAWGLYGACVGHVFGELAMLIAGLVVLRVLGVNGPSWLQVAKVIPASVAMLIVLIPFMGPRATLLSMIVFSPIALLVYFMAAIACRAWPWSDVVQVWHAALRPRIARWSAAADLPPNPAAQDMNSEVRC